MDTLFTWKSNFALTNPFYVVAILVNSTKKPVGIRLSSLAGTRLIDVPMETLAESTPTRIPTPTTSAELEKFYMKHEVLCSINISPFDVGMNRIFIADGKAEQLVHEYEEILFRDDAFEPVKVKNDYTSFICPNVVIRIAHINECTKHNIEVVNRILYGTNFFQQFGITSMDEWSFLDYNDGIFVSMKTWKLACSDFWEDFDAIADKFCDDHGLPKKAITRNAQRTNIYLTLDAQPCTDKDTIKPNIPVFSAIDRHSPFVNGNLTGLAKAFGHQTVAWVIPKYGLEKLSRPYVFDEGPASCSSGSLSNAQWFFCKHSATFRQYFRKDRDTFVITVGYLPPVHTDEEVRELIDTTNAIMKSEEMAILEDCLISRDTILGYPLGFTECPSLTKKVKVDGTAFGERNKDELIRTIIKAFKNQCMENSCTSRCLVSDDGPDAVLTLTAIQHNTDMFEDV